MSGIIKATNLEVTTIKDKTNSNTAMSIDSSGRVTQSQLPFFHVQHPVVGSSTSTNGHITFPTVITNQGNHWDTSGNYFLAPVTGIYQFNFTGIGAGSSGGVVANGGEVQVILQVSTDNGSNYTYSIYGAYFYWYGGGSSGLPHISFGSSIKLTANDRVRINANKGYVFTGSVANKYVPALTGHLVG